MAEGANDNLDAAAAVERASSVAVVERFMGELRDNVASVQREEALRQLQSLFAMRRLDAASQVEAVRARALQRLAGKLDNMPAGLLLKTIETLSSVGEPDIGAATGVTTKGGGVNINNTLQNRNAAVSAAGGTGAPPVSGPGSRVSGATVHGGIGLLEALEALSSRMAKANRRVTGAEPVREP